MFIYQSGVSQLGRQILSVDDLDPLDNLLLSVPSNSHRYLGFFVIEAHFASAPLGLLELYSRPVYGEGFAIAKQNLYLDPTVNRQYVMYWKVEEVNWLLNVFS